MLCVKRRRIADLVEMMDRIMCLRMTKHWSQLYIYNLFYFVCGSKGRYDKIEERESWSL